ncbi:MAG: chromosome partitioning protein ParB, partial [Lewinellaceae bacterium]|nr:chromosome partitioning protein ParB [Lewinellaceae bacterium]
FGDAKIIGDAGLYEKFKKIEASGKVALPKYEYPDHVVTVSGISFMVEKGISIKIDKKSAKHWRCLASQKKHGKAIFGSGFLVSEKAAAEKAAAEKAAAENVYTMQWELSDKEWGIIRSLG